jgi:hypothetical protein
MKTNLYVIKSKPPGLWWLNPWPHARSWFAALSAMRAYADRVDRALELQDKVIGDQSAEITRLRRQLDDALRGHEAKNATIAGTAQDRDNLLECGADLADAVRKGKHVDFALEEWDKATEVPR